MKTRILCLVAIFAMSMTSVLAQTTTRESFKVYGNCGMCETRIEKAAKAVEGVSAADWDKETKMIAVTFDKSKTDVEKVQKAIAKVGHDTDSFKADDKVYAKLPKCCLYERTAEKKGE